MASPYTSVTVPAAYNANPPSNDGSQTAENLADWSGQVIQKVGAPLKSAIESVDSNVSDAFGKVMGGAGASGQASSYVVQSSDQSKIIYYTGSGSHTFTTPDATIVGTPFSFQVANLGTTDLTLDGSGSQTVNGSPNVTVKPGQTGTVFTDGANWFMPGLYIQETSGKEIGEVWVWAGALASTPARNVVCQGQSLATADFPDLFTAIGYTFGGSGANFSLPDAKGRSLLFEGQGDATAEGDTTGTDRSRGDVGGYETHTLLLSESPAHTHTFGNNDTFGAGATNAWNRSGSTGAATDSAGGDGAHNNMHPWLCVGALVIFTNQTDHDYLGVIS